MMTSWYFRGYFVGISCENEGGQPLIDSGTNRSEWLMNNRSVVSW